MEKTYFDIRVTFVHVVIFLIAVIAIGIFLFYMGYQAGQRISGQPADIVQSGQQEEAVLDSSERIDLDAEKPLKSAVKSIPEEMKLHERQLAKETPPATGKNVFPDQNYAIQVGAFADFGNAQRYSEKFAKLGYQTEIIVENITGKKLHTVRVGSFVTLEEAQNEKIRLEGLEKKKFKIKKGR